MILYFTDRGLNVIGIAGNKLENGYNIYNDEKEIDVDTGVATFSFDISYTSGSRSKVEKLTFVGNYILRYSQENREYECYTIIDSEQDTETQTINVRAEDMGLDLINDIALPFNYEVTDLNSDSYSNLATSASSGRLNASGGVSSDNNYKTTGFIELTYTTVEAYLYYVSKSSASSLWFGECFYDSSKNYIGGYQTDRYLSDSSQTSRIDIPANTKYVRLSFHKDIATVKWGPSSVFSYPITTYISQTIENSGFEIGLNEFGATELALEFDDTQTCSERLLEIASYYGAEIGFSYEFNNLKVSRKLVNIYRRRGADNKVELRLGKDVKNIRVKRSVAELATAVLAIGHTVNSEGAEQLFTLEGYEGTLESGYYIDGNLLCSRAAYSKWSRFLSSTGRRSGHIKKTFDYDCETQKTLYEYALADLKTIEKEDVSYEIDLYSLPDSCKLGDTVYVIDDAGEIYISARIFNIKQSVCNDTIQVTLGDFVVKNSGIVDKWDILSKQFQQWADTNHARYTWTAYADDNQGTGISLDPTGKTYIGVATNQKNEEPDISDPSVYSWSVYMVDEIPTYTYEPAQYAVSDSGNVPPLTGWSEAIPSNIDGGEYLWTKTTVSSDDPDVDDVDYYSVARQGEDGDQGPFIRNIIVEYALSTSDVTPGDSLQPTSALEPGADLEPTNLAWYVEPPTFVQGYYYWHRIKTIYGDDTVVYSDPVLDDALNDIWNATTEYYSEFSLDKQHFTSLLGSIEQFASKFDEHTSAINQTAQTIETTVNQKLDNYYTKAEFGTAVSQNASAISAAVWSSEDGEKIMRAMSVLDEYGLHVKTASQDSEAIVDGSGIYVTKKVNGVDVVVAEYTNNRAYTRDLLIDGYAIFAAHQVSLYEDTEGDGVTTIGTGFTYTGSNS